MKKILFTILSSASVMFSVAQSCGTNGSSVCVPQGGPPQGGFPENSTISCAEQNVPYEATINFTMFDQFDFLGLQEVDSVEFLHIDNLPCGLCWAVNQTDKRYTANEDGCIKISGTTNDVVGQYKLGLDLRAWINHGTTPVDPGAFLVDQTGTRLIIRVKANGSSNCPAPDTAANSTLNLTASTNCPLGINELNNDVTSLRIAPSPVNQTATVSFVAVKAAVYTIKVTDMTGKLISTEQINANVGNNQTIINRNGLPAGIYFLSINDGKTAITQRFTIAD